jgi:spermidine/putrescine transport system permease protein
LRQNQQLLHTAPGSTPTALEAEPFRAIRRSTGSVAKGQRLTAYSLLTPGMGWLLFFFIIPVLIMGITSLKSGGALGGYHFTWSISTYATALEGKQVFFTRSVWYAFLTAAGTIALAYPAVYWIAFYGGRWKSTFLFMILLPYFVSFMIRTVMWKFILADNGPFLGSLKDLGLLGADFHVLATPFAVVGGLIYNYLPFSALPLFVALDRIDPRLIESAKDLYATPAKAFLKVVFPLSMPGLFAATLLTFVPATGDYVEAEVLGGPGTTMIGNIIQDEFLYRARYPIAAALSIVLMLAMVLLTSIYARTLGTEDETLAAGVGA